MEKSTQNIYEIEKKLKQVEEMLKDLKKENKKIKKVLKEDCKKLNKCKCKCECNFIKKMPSGFAKPTTISEELCEFL